MNKATQNHPAKRHKRSIFKRKLAIKARQLWNSSAANSGTEIVPSITHRPRS